MKLPSYNLSTKKVAGYAVVFLLSVSIIALATVEVVQVYGKFTRALPAMEFAYQNPDIVEPMKEQYTRESQALKDSMIKRQDQTLMQMDFTNATPSALSK